MSAGPETDEDDLKRSPTAQQSVAVTQVTATSEVIGAPGTLRVLADQIGPASGRAGPAAAGADNKRPPPRKLAAISARTRKREAVYMSSN
jgi:hypothetical protein